MPKSLIEEGTSLELTGLQLHRNLLPEGAVRFLKRERARLCGQIEVPRPWHYAELHNPWSGAAAFYDSWGFLDLCQSSPLVQAIARQIGEDVILFDSQWLPDRWHDPGVACESDAHRFAVDPPSGVTALIALTDGSKLALQSAFAPMMRPFDRSVTIELDAGDVLLVGHEAAYRLESSSRDAPPVIYAVRYFAASSRYLRDPASSMQRALTERYPLLNYARMPLWLVHGEDRAQNDFVTGFNARAGFWTNARW